MVRAGGGGEVAGRRRRARGCARSAPGGGASAPTRRRSSLPGLSRIRLETPSLPMSCSSAARRRSRSSRELRPSTSPTATAMRATPTEWRAGVGRLGVDDQRERLGDAVEPLAVGVLDAVRGLEGADHRVRLVAAERAPERAVAARGAQRVDQRGIEPGAAARRRRRRTRRAGRRRRRTPRRSGRGRRCGRAAGSRRRRGRRGSRRRPSARRAPGSPRRSTRSARSCGRSRRRARSAARSCRGRPRRRCGRSRPAGACGRSGRCTCSASNGRRWLVSLRARLSSKSSAPNSADSLAALLEQPASLSSSA